MSFSIELELAANSKCKLSRLSHILKHHLRIEVSIKYTALAIKTKIYQSRLLINKHLRINVNTHLMAMKLPWALFTIASQH